MSFCIMLSGPGKAIYKVGEAGKKGHDCSEEKLYCQVCSTGVGIGLDLTGLLMKQVAIERQQTLFIDDPTKYPGLEKNEDWVKFGYGYYVGAPWVVGQTKG